MRTLRALWRLSRCVVHGLHGLAIVAFGFASLARPEREARIRWWSLKMLRLIGIGLVVDGAPAEGGCLLVLNHVSWLDIMVVHAVAPRARFVSKADVKGWPLVSRLVDSANTIYLAREKKRDALRVMQAISQALEAGDLVAVFPEGTTSTGHGLLPFHANLLQSAVASASRVQPAALRYSERGNEVSEAVEFIGDTSLATSLWRTAGGEGVVVTLRFLPLRAAAGLDRRALATALRGDIAAALGTDPAAPAARDGAAGPAVSAASADSAASAASAASDLRRVRGI